MGSLHGLCAKKKISVPTFHTEVVVTVTVVCTVGKFKESGSAGSKKVAKREAAQKMMGKLKDLGPNKEQVPPLVWLSKGRRGKGSNGRDKLRIFC